MGNEEANKDCKHTGAWRGAGQSVVGGANNLLIVIVTLVCGECGNVKTEVRNVQVKVAQPQNSIALPKMVIPTNLKK